MRILKISKNISKARYNQPYKDRILFTLQSCIGSSIFYLTSGAFMSGYAALLGATEQEIGLIEVFSKVAGTFQLFSPMLLKKFKSRKWLVTILMGIYKLLICSVILIPFFLPYKLLQPKVLILMVFSAYIFMHLAWPDFMCWIMSVVPKRVRGKFFGIRYSYALLLSTIFSITMGFLVDHFKTSNPYRGFAIVFSISFILSVIDICIHFFINDTKNEESTENIRLRDCIIIPLQTKGYSKVIILFILWNIAINVGTPFLSIFQIKYLQVDYKYIMFFNLLMNVATIVSTRFWGRYADRYSWSHTMLLSISVYASSQLLWITTGSNRLFVLPAIFIVTGIAWGGLTNSIQNLPFEYAPKENKSIYVGFIYVVGGVFGITANLIAGRLISIFGVNKVSLLSVNVYGIQILTLISALIMIIATLYGIIFLIGTKKACNNEVKVKVNN